MSVASEMHDLRVALSEVDVLVALTRKAHGDANWSGVDSAVVEVIATLLRLIEKSSFSAMSVFHRLHRVVPDTQPRAAPTIDSPHR
jgi:hypothetical protein